MKAPLQFLVIVLVFCLAVWGIKSCGERMTAADCAVFGFSDYFELDGIHPDVASGAKVTIVKKGAVIDSTLVITKSGDAYPKKHPDYIYRFEKPLPVDAKWIFHFRNGRRLVVSDFRFSAQATEDGLLSKNEGCKVMLDSFRVDGKWRTNDLFTPNFGELQK